MTAQQNSRIRGGGCLCGAVTYRVSGPLRPVIACHCTQCRKTLGHFAASTAAYREDLQISGETELQDYVSSPGVRRRFCRHCGSAMFWDNDQRDYVSIWAGTLTPPTGLELAMHIYTGDKGDYYQILDDVPCLPASGQVIPMPPRKAP